ncbi:glycosyltransferase [Prosthecomicrobium pneumaticum]|uniref:Glycosyltransferase Alg8 n=1 Tax=Prosthecomicrobium pneumaticum TaxID=81895 RepID=A0A7W9FQT4_9HYPH|nr:glycosyltransferase [Prosthecomicrobium pneumaticum]MBB5755155.1 glycosyltransferase Alg8 [Prosthecomicrobium pneumaticum]
MAVLEAGTAPDSPRIGTAGGPHGAEAGTEPRGFHAGWPWLLAGAVLVWATLLVLVEGPIAARERVFLVLGVLGAWRYGWALLHLVRALAFLRIVMPRKRARARRADIAAEIDHVYAVVCSFGIPAWQFRAVYRSLIENCLATGLPATIVASITSDRDCAILDELFAEAGRPADLRIVAQFQRGTGKRDAIAMALRTIARKNPSARSATLMLDGDVVLTPGALAESLRFFAADPGLAALTTNNDARLAPGDPSADWYRLRFAQRHLMMSSLALSDRLLVLTGRFSVYRTPHLVDAQTIELIQNDAVDNWLHGRIRLLSGDDKSMWYAILRRGGRMLYLPHVYAVSFEAMPRGAGFLAGSTRLMLRWFGNMIRANGRSMRLGPRRCGPFLWWCLLDQRLSVVTTQFGFATALAIAVGKDVRFVVVYLAWLFVSRSLLALIYGGLWGRVVPSWPVLLAYTQIWGSALKLYLFFRPDRQAWTRQLIRRGGGDRGARLAATTLYLLTVGTIAGAAAATAHIVAGG